METLYPNSSCFSNELLLSSQTLPSSSSSSEWTKEENKQFEKALAIYDKETPDRWWNIANMAGRSMEDVMAKYRELLDDVTDIEAGRFPLPFNAFDHNICITSSRDYDYAYRKKPSSAAAAAAGTGSGSVRGGGGSSDQEIRKKGIPWTEDEHRRFLKGLMKYGKGDWRNISRNFVFTKTPTQVASHAQKYFIRQQQQQQQQQLCESKDHNNKRRPSIHDITTNNLMSTQSSQYNNNTIFDHLNTPLQQTPPNNYNYNFWTSSSSSAGGWSWLEERALQIFRANYQAAAGAGAANYHDIAAVAAAAASSSSKMQQQQQQNVDLHLPSSSSSDNTTTTTLLGIQSNSSFRIYG